MDKEQELQNEIAEAIKKNLPAQVGNALQEELKELQTLRKLYETEKKISTERLERLGEKDQELRRMGEIIAEHDDLTSRANKLEEELNRFEVEKLKYQLEAEKDKSSFAKNIGLSLVRNTVWRENSLGTVPMVEKYSDGSTYTTQTTVDLHHNKSAE